MGEGRFSLTIPQLLQRAYKERPDNEVIFDGKRKMSYRELQHESLQLANALYKQGLRKGDLVGVSLPNWYESIVIYFAVSSIGAILVPFNPRYRLHEVEFILHNADPKVVFVSSDFTNFLDSNLVTSRSIIAVRFSYEKFQDYETLLSQGEAHTLPEDLYPDINDPFAILYTSGSTGEPKGVILSHQNINYTSTITAEGLACTSDDVFLVPVPLFHVFGIVSCLVCTIVCQGRMVLMQRFQAKEALSIIEHERVTIHHAVPTMFIMELNDPDFDSFNLSSLRTGIIAAAPCPADTIRQIRSRMGCDICVSYGATETSAALTMTGFSDEEHLKSETVGRLVEGAQIKIVNMHGQQAAIGEVGEVLCNSPGLMIGYFNVTHQNESIDSEGWYHSGDLGTLDESGFLRIVGRTKEMIIRGGYNIYPREIEELLYDHPLILEAAVIGIPDPVMGERTCAVIKLKDTNVNEDAIKQFLKGNLANYKIPDMIVFTEDLPLTASGKILKTELKKRILMGLQSN